MFTTLFSLSLLLTLARFVLAQSDFTIDTPSFVQCQQANITWANTNNPPYDLLIVSANDECGPALVDLGNQTSTPFSWTVAIKASTPVVLSLMDAAGAEAWSGVITVGPSNDNSCLASKSSSAPTTTPIVPETSHSPFPTTTFAPAGAAGAGIASSSGALSTRHLSAFTLLGCAAFAVVTFTL